MIKSKTIAKITIQQDSSPDNIKILPTCNYNCYLEIMFTNTYVGVQIIILSDL